MRRVIILCLIAILAMLMLYVSRFWPLSLWSRPGLFGLDWLPPQGGLLGRWLRGTVAAPYELIIWATGCFVLLTWAQKLYDRATSDADPETADSDG
jgi:hypothetical protein